MKQIILAIIVALLLFFMIADVARAQDKIQITGTLTDSTSHAPIGFATVSLKTDKNAPVKVMLSKDDGSFKLDVTKQGDYNLVVSVVGYQTKTIAVNSKSANLGTITLAQSGKQLKGVEIAANRPIVKQEADRVTYDMQADPDAKVSNLLDMMRKLPYVTVDGDDNILLKGQSSYKILINGKPSSMMERDPKNIMRSIPASTIQRIEVITIPPAKYDAEGLGGIINIITNKKVDAGYNGTLNANGNYPSGPGIGTSFTVKSGKFGVSGYAGGNLSNNPVTIYSTERTTTGPTTDLVQNGNSKGNGRNGYFSAELSYEIDSLNLVSGQFNINGNKNNSNSYQTSFLTGPKPLGYNLTNLGNGNGSGNDASLNYQLGFKNDKNKLLTFSYRYWDYNSYSANSIATTNRVGYNTPDYNQNNETFASEHTLQADYAKSNKQWNLETGLKTIFRDAKSDFEYNSLDAPSGQFLPNSALSNNFNYTQDIYAGYISTQYKGKAWGIKAGLRAEQTVTDANFLSTASSVHQNYFDVVPQVAINLEISKSDGFNAGFSQRLKRPNINRLNPYVDRSNPNFVSTGNPDLHRTLINEIQFGYHYNGAVSLNIGTVYDFVTGLDMNVSTYDPATQITTTTYQNLGKARGLGASVNVNWPIGKKLNYSLNSNTMFFWIDGPVNGVEVENQVLAVNVATSLGYNFDKGWRVSGEFDINGRNPTGLQGYRKAFTGSVFNVNKQIIKNKLTASASVRNPFTKYRTDFTLNTADNFVQTNYNQVNYRSFTVSLNYNFGKLKEGIKKSQHGINNDDK